MAFKKCVGDVRFCSGSLVRRFKKCDFFKIKVKKGERMKFWNIIIIFAYIYAFVLKSVVRLVWLTFLGYNLCRGLSPNLLRQTNSIYLNIVGL